MSSQEIEVEHMYLDAWEGGNEHGRDEEGIPGSEHIYEICFSKI